MRTIILSNGIEMPPIIMSTNHMDYKKMKEVVLAGLKIGFRAFDTARDYGNEPIVGRVLKECLHETGMRREDIFITTKIGNQQQRDGNISEQIDRSLDNLQTDYVDCWMMHWPYPGYYVETYHKMEGVYKNGKVRSIGMANFHVRHFDKLWASGLDVIPHCVQFEHHPLRTTADILSFCKDHDIAVQAYSPLCRMMPAIKESPILKAIAEKTGKTIAQVVLRWHYQHRSVPCFLSTNLQRLKENFSLFDFELSDEEMERINGMNQDYKYHLESASCPGF